MAAAAVMAAADDRVERVVICTPDKDLGQCVGGKVVQFDRRKGQEFDAAGVEARLGVPPASIPDLLVARGRLGRRVPGPAGVGRQVGGRRAAPLGPPRGHPRRPRRPGTPACGARRSSTPCCASEFELALLFRRIATVETDAPVSDSVDDLRWSGPPDPDAYAAMCDKLGAPGLVGRSAAVLARVNRSSAGP